MVLPESQIQVPRLLVNRPDLCELQPGRAAFRERALNFVKAGPQLLEDRGCEPRAAGGC